MTQLNANETALVLIEFQNDFTTEGGAFHGAVSEVMGATEMLPKAAHLVQQARARGVTVMHAPITFKPGYNEISDHPYGILKGVVDNNAFVKGEWGAEITDAIPIDDGDIVIEGKRGLDTFASTNLDFILRSKGIKNVVLAGFLTNCCVESTMRTAYENGFNVVTVTDCCAAVSPEQHKAAVEFDFPMFSHPMTQAEVLEAIG
ncbi:MAG: isochorismatase [Myxococcales bacterium]|nr:isochorismatase [Myxococcales bacterium]